MSYDTITLTRKEFETLLTHSVQLEAVMATFLTKEEQDLVNDCLEMSGEKRIEIDDTPLTAEEVLAEYEELRERLREKGYC
jgi:hypothetical protein